MSGAIRSVNRAEEKETSPPPASLSHAAIPWRRSKAALRLLATITVTFLGLLFVTFFIGRVIPIDPVISVVGERASAEIYDAAFKAMGLDKPLYEQFIIYVGKVLTGDFGMSMLTGHAVVDDIIRVFPATLELSTVATLFGVVFGIPLGVVAAVNQGRWIDQVIRAVGLFGYSMPVFWLGLMGLLVFYGILGWVSGPGRLDFTYDDMIPTVTGVILIDSLIAGDMDIFANAISHLILPASVLGYYSLAYISRMTRSLMLEQLSQEYVTTARVKGLSEGRVVWRHALGNVMVPLITVIALSYANLLEGSVLTEMVFAWPGLGYYITNALMSADMNAVLGGTVVVGTMFIGLNLLSDFLYRFVDPRAK
jgi:peptide/nickel transport system permease protein